MTTPTTAAATAPSRAVKPVALLFPLGVVIPVPVDVVVGLLPPTAVVVLPPRPSVVVAGLVVALPKPVPEGVAVAELVVTLPPLPKPVPEGVDPVVELELLPVLFIETEYPTPTQSTRPNERSLSETVY
jgi:hypothetical protein